MKVVRNGRQAMKMIDSYVHCGQSKYRPLPELERAMEYVGIEQSVLVQHLGEFDNSYIGDIVAAQPSRFVGVCLVDYTLDTASNNLRRWANTGRFRGVRLLMESLQDYKKLWCEAKDLGFILLVFDPIGIMFKLGLLMKFVEENPTAVVILSHLGMPNISVDPGFVKYEAIFELSRYPNVYFQVSGMHMFCHYPYKPLIPLIRRALTTFGADRMLWGSNYPVIGSDEDLLKDVEFVRSGGLTIDKSILCKILYTTAQRIWFSHTQ